MISTKNLSGLPDVNRLRAFCKGLAALDIIMLEKEWSFIRHYTYNPIWRKGNREFSELISDLMDIRGGQSFRCRLRVVHR